MTLRHTTSSRTPARLLAVWRAMCRGLLALCLAAPAHAGKPELAQLLAYDHQAPLGLQLISRKPQSGVLIDDVAYDSAAGLGRTMATLVRPAEHGGPHAGIVWGHWFEPAAVNSNRSQFLREAAALARLGVVSLLPATLWSEPAWFDKRNWRQDFAQTIAQARDFRRALGVLLAQADVDAQRVAFVGHDFSALISRP
jgi:hypothetical protein